MALPEGQVVLDRDYKGMATWLGLKPPLVKEVSMLHPCMGTEEEVSASNYGTRWNNTFLRANGFYVEILTTPSLWKTWWVLPLPSMAQRGGHGIGS